jgi:outer membrane lipoprotein-sorting protein
MCPLQSPLQRAAVAVAVVCLATAGIYVAFGGDAGTAADEAIGENASERYESIDGVSANVTMVMETPNETSRMALRIKERPGTQYLYQRVYNGSGEYHEMYSNGTIMWQYDPQKREATRMTLDNRTFEQDGMAARLDELFTQIDAGGEERNGPKPGVSPLPGPASPVTSDPAVGNVAPPNSTEYDVNYLGTETIDGRETHVVKINGTLRGRGEMMLSNMTQTLWIDAERYYPLKYYQTWDRPDGTYEVTQTYTNVTFDPGLDDADFEFDPPENVTVNERTMPAIETYDSRSETAESADIPIPDPAVPDGFALEQGQLIDGDSQSVSLTYANETGEIVVTVQNATHQGSGNGEEISVNGRNGTYSEFGETGVASWTCGDRTYSVMGKRLNRSVVVDVAESIRCANGSTAAVQRVRDKSHAEELKRPNEEGERLSVLRRDDAAAEQKRADERRDERDAEQ